MGDQNKVFNEFTDLISWMNESNLFEATRKDNTKNLLESNNKVGENLHYRENQLVVDNKNNSSDNMKITNKKSRCDVCKGKISLVDELISTCRCGKKHCSKHRMPETHKCNKMEEIGKDQKKFLESSLVKLGSSFVHEKI
jgi:hypothetical protein